MLISDSLFGIIYFADSGIRHVLATKYGQQYEICSVGVFADKQGQICVVAGDSPVRLHNHNGEGVPPRITRVMRFVGSPDIGRCGHTFTPVAPDDVVGALRLVTVA